MKITTIRIKLCRDEKLKAFVGITLDDCFAIRGIKIIKGRKGLFVAMPCRQLPDGRTQDICHPIDRETRGWMEDCILSSYQQELEGKSPGEPEDGPGNRARDARAHFAASPHSAMT
jgi:stage V sporulation protein G